MGPLCLVQVSTKADLKDYLPGLIALVTPWRAVLEVDAHPPLNHPQVLDDSMQEMMPYLWLAHDDAGMVLAAVGFTDLEAGRFAFIHGLRATEARRHPGLKCLVQLALAEAFLNQNLQRVYARFESDNLGALGFCWQNGFQKLATLPQVVVQNGLPKDQFLFGLFQETYHQRHLPHCFRTTQP